MTDLSKNSPKAAVAPASMRASFGFDRTAMIVGSRPRLNLRTFVLAVCAAVLTWLVISKSLAAYLADAAPQWALFLDSRQPDALLKLADRSLNPVSLLDPNANIIADRPSGQNDNVADNTSSQAAPDSANLTDTFSKISTGPAVDLAALQDEVSEAVFAQPLSAHGLRLLGQIADTGGDKAKAFSFMSTAAQLSSHETLAVYWLMRNSADTRDYDAAVHYADIMLRTNPQLAQYVVPVLAKIATDKNSFGIVKDALQRHPPWRDQFFALLPSSVTDGRTPLSLLLALRNDPVPLKTADIKPYITALLSNGYYSLAYYTWLQFLKPEDLLHAGLLFNGNFDSDPSGLPFDWTIQQGSGVTIDMVPRPDKAGARALLVDFKFGRVDYHSVTELVMLAPGNYQFSGEYKGELVGPRGMKWRLVCANAERTVVAESAMINGTTKNWTTLTFSFTIPDKGCNAQYVRLDLDARMASEALVSGSVLFDNFRISRVANTAASGGKG